MSVVDNASKAGSTAVVLEINISVPVAVTEVTGSTVVVSISPMLVRTLRCDAPPAGIPKPATSRPRTLVPSVVIRNVLVQTVDVGTVKPVVVAPVLIIRSVPVEET